MHNFKIFFITLFVSLSSQATLRLVGASGASASGVTTDGTNYIYGGYIQGADTTCGTSTCDTCLGGSGFQACNESTIVPAATLQFTITTDNSTILSQSPVVLFCNDTSDISSKVTKPTLSGNTLSFSDTWARMCEGMGNTSCTSNTSASTIKVAIAPSSAGATCSSPGTEVISLKMQVRYIATTEKNHTLCPSNDSSSGGFCNFTLFPGDQKAYITSVFGTTSDSSGNADITKVVFFYEPFTYVTDTTQRVANMEAALDKIKNTSASTIFTVNTDYEVPLSDDRIKGLTNDSGYCFIMANQDDMGNIYAATPITSYTTIPLIADKLAAEKNICVVPSPVVGLLDDKKCFIATAAWGSELDSHVQRFRDFRDRFLKGTTWGNAFIQFYYSNSPDWVRTIRSNEPLRTSVRAALWPLYYFADVSLEWGIAWSIVIFALGLGAMILIFYSLLKVAFKNYLVRRQQNSEEITEELAKAPSCHE